MRLIDRLKDLLLLLIAFALNVLTDLIYIIYICARKWKWKIKYSLLLIDYKLSTLSSPCNSWRTVPTPACIPIDIYNAYVTNLSLCTNAWGLYNRVQCYRWVTRWSKCVLDNSWQWKPMTHKGSMKETKSREQSYHLNKR